MTCQQCGEAHEGACRTPRQHIEDAAALAEQLYAVCTTDPVKRVAGSQIVAAVLDEWVRGLADTLDAEE